MSGEPGDDLISFLVAEAHGVIGRELQQDELFGMCLLLLLAGIDTTWSAIGASIWHLAGHPDDQQRLRDDPSLWPVAVEELLRGVRAGHDGARGGAGHRVPGLPDAQGRPAAVAVPVGQPRPGGVRPRRRSRHRPRREPSPGVRRRHPPLPRVRTWPGSKCRWPCRSSSSASGRSGSAIPTPCGGPRARCAGHECYPSSSST